MVFIVILQDHGRAAKNGPELRAGLISPARRYAARRCYKSGAAALSVARVVAVLACGGMRLKISRSVASGAKSPRHRMNHYQR
jgi:hypothetical protein